MQKADSLRQEEAGKVEPYFMRPAEDQGERPQLGPISVEEIIPVETYNDFVAVLRDVASTTIAISGDAAKLPTGTVVGVAAGSRMSLGVRVRFNEPMKVAEIDDHPEYRGRRLVIIPEKHILFRIP